MDRIKIKGFLHFRTDLGDGIRTGIVFDSCRGSCDGFCSPFRLIREHPFAEDSLEKDCYSPQELIEYLKEEKMWCFSKPLGITFLGKEPMAHTSFCREVSRGIKELGMSLQVYTCGLCPFYAYDTMYENVDLFIFNFFTVHPKLFRTYHRGYSLDDVMEKVYYLDRKRLPYRLRIPVVSKLNDTYPSVLADFCLGLKNVKSVILDFSLSGFSDEQIRQYRRSFLEKGVILY